MMRNITYFLFLIPGLLTLHACSTQQPEETLRLLDVQGENVEQNEVFV